MSRPDSAEEIAPAPSAARSPFEADSALILRHDCTLADVERGCDLARRLRPFARVSWRRDHGEPLEPAEVWQRIQQARRELEDDLARAAAPILPAEIEEERLTREWENANPQCAITPPIVRPTDNESIRESLADGRKGRAWESGLRVERARQICAPSRCDDFVPQRWAQLVFAGLAREASTITDIEGAIEFLEAAAAPRARRADPLPSNFAALMQRERELMQSLLDAMPSPGRRPSAQQTLEHPEFARLYRAAWKAAPEEVRIKIEDCLKRIGLKPRHIVRERFCWLSHFAEGGAEKLDREIAAALARLAESIADQERRELERQAREEAERQRREALSRLTPEEREKMHAEHKRRRIAKAARLLRERLERGGTITPRPSCLMCGRFMHDPVSKLYGIGPDCREQMVDALGEHEALSLCESLKKQFEEQRKR